MRQSLIRSGTLPDTAATERLGRQLATALGDRPGGWLILLRGELGSGKSTLARAMLRAFGHKGAVPSPTYTLIEPYNFSNFTAYHIDLYRIVDPDELEYLGWSDLEHGLRMVEWPERIPGLEAQADLVVRLGYEGIGRSVAVSGVSERGARLLAGINLN